MKRLFLRFLGWTALLDVPLFLAGIFVLVVFNVYLKFCPEEPYFELFLTKVFYDDHADPIYHLQPNPSPEEKLELEWEVNEEDLRSLKKIRMRLTNHGDAFYADTRDVEDNYWIHARYTTYKGNDTDTYSDGMWCGTGMFYQLVEADEVIDYTWYNSIFEKLTWFGGYRPEEKINFKSLIDSTFGDSTEVYWTLTTFSVPWSHYVPQSVESPSFMLYPDALKETWNEIVGFPAKKSLFDWGVKNSDTLDLMLYKQKSHLYKHPEFQYDYLDYY